jgi:class 3 adenylate cyclase
MLLLLGWSGVVFPTFCEAAFFQRSEGRFLVLQGEVSYRRDLAPSANIEQVLAANTGWVAQKEKPFPPTLDPIELWVRFDLPEVQASRAVLLDSSPWETVDYYFVRDGRLVEHQRTGTLVPLAERSARITMTTHFSHAGFVAVSLLPGSRITVYARMASEQQVMPIRWLRFYLWDKEEVLAGERRDRFFQGVFFGAMFVLVVYNLGLYFTTREPSYLYYVITVAGGHIVWGMVFGLTVEFLWPNHPTWELAAAGFGFLVSCWAGCQFIRAYLDTSRHFPRSDKMLKWAGLATLLLFPLLFVLPVRAVARAPELLGPWALVVTGLLVGVIGLAMVRRHPLARPLLLAAAVAGSGSLVVTGAILEVLPATDFTLHAGEIGSAACGIILSMGLGLRLQQLRADVADRQLKEARLQSAHEREKRELTEEHSRGLETKVRERTSELLIAQGKSDALLANILPQAIIEELKLTGATEPRRHEEVSILFTDFSSFTQTVATIPAKRLVQELDEIFRGFDGLAAVHGLEKIKTIGDAYMAASGLPLSAADHAVRCVRAALALTAFIEERNKTAALKWNLRVGVHSGAVVAGVVGKHKYAYDVWGDTVNIASRLESASDNNRVNISAYTYELVRGRFACEYRGKIAAKGKGEIDMYHVVREIG